MFDKLDKMVLDSYTTNDIVINSYQSRIFITQTQQIYRIAIENDKLKKLNKYNMDGYH